MKKVAAFSIPILLVAAAFNREGALGALLSSNYLPHRYCYRADPGLVWTNVSSDALIAASYVLIFASLIWVAGKLHRLPQLRGFIWIFVAFGTFILSCAVTHGMELITVWLPFYPLAAALKVVCAAVSVPTAILFVRESPAIVGNVSRFFDLLSIAQRGEKDAVANYRGQIEAIGRSQMMVEFAMDGSILRANDNYLCAFGYTGAEISGKNHSSFVTAEYRSSMAYAEFWDALRSGAFQSGLFARIGKGGKEVWVEASYNPVPGPDGSPVKVVEFASDVTARISAQIELKDTQARLQAIVNSVADGIITIDQTGIIVSFNPAATRMFEYEESEVAGKNVRMLMPEPNRGAHDGYLARHRSTGKSTAIGVGRLLEGLTSTGRAFPMELTVTEMSLQGQKFFVGLVRDISERSLHEKALRKSEAFLEQVGRLAGVGGWEIELATNEVTWTAETYRILGADSSHRPTREDLVKLPMPEFRELIAEAIEKATANGTGWDLELALTRFDGKPIWVRSVGRVETIDGQPVRRIGAFQDMTARILERRALQDANERAALAAESGGIGIWSVDLPSLKVQFDPLMYRLYGFDPECGIEADVAFWMGRVHPDDRPAVEKAFQDGVDGIKAFQQEFRIVWNDGSVHYISATGNVIRDKSGNAIRIVGTSMEITARKQAEELLRDQANLLDLSHDGIMVRELDGTISFWSQGAEEMYGYSKQQAEGRRSHDILCTIFPKPLREIEADLLKNGRWDGELEHTIRGSTHIVVESRWVLQRVAGGADNRVLEVNNDITVRKRAEEESLRNTQALMRSNQELDEFAYAASHDLKAPLRVIYNASKWLEEDLDPFLTPDTRKDMELLRGRVVRMEKLLDDLLEYSRIGRNSNERHIEVLSGEKLMENILGLVSLPAGFTLNLSPSLASIQVKRMPLQQVLINLIGNAVKHHDKESGGIQVSVEDLGTHLEFAVSDDGPGIPKQFQEQIFKMFQTLKPRDQVEGSGMGLAMVRKYVEFSGGSIKVESAEGQGSRFRFTWSKQLPAEEEPQ